MVPCLGNYKSQQAPRPRCLVFPGLLEQSLLGNVVLAAQVISAESLVGVILTPTGKRLRPRSGVGGNGREMEEGRGLLGVGAGVLRPETPFSFGFGFGSGDCGCCRGQGSGPWDFSSDLSFDVAQLIGHQPHILVDLSLVLPVQQGDGE